MNDRPVYLDHQATTPVDPRVVEAMLPYLTSEFGNPSSSHAYGRTAAAAVATARTRVAALIGAAGPDEIVFTSSGTESNHLALTGAAHALRAAGRGNHIVTTAIEHPATQATCDRLAGEGFRVTRLPVGTDGRLDPAGLVHAVGPDTVLVSVMHANNEIGTLQPLPELAAVTRERGILLHTDAAQSPATVAVDVGALGVDLLTLVGHKMYAPKGVGALYIRRGTPALRPQLVGGGQEHGLRAATENVPGIVALGAAAEIAQAEHGTDAARIGAHRDRLLGALTTAVPGLRLNGSSRHRLPGNLSLTFPGHTADRIMTATPGLAFSAGSACHRGDTTPSPVLTAIGLTPDEAARTVRLGIGRHTTSADITTAAELLVSAATAPVRP
ncbi:cysteine desulfurase family protein [Streptomyces xinghaiensis]|uniref:cysteine desulfurase family protein n=1 Tax=Streptomyces xinghaiensis TaxID=1038928 RepID=UPI0002E2E140|nr:cysteine desulfurase family protein [Streptomyces xinghaiensis]MZE77616.1 aminotransferase class V-fold PLP-dependent enzyme [Streptomyces sp. SID5475]